MSTKTSAVSFDEKAIDAIFAGVDTCHLPGAAVGIAIGGRPVYRKGFGLANMELPVVLGPSMRMRIGSTTKHFAALAYMLLCEDGRAGLDDPVGKHIPELNAVARGLTMRRLMGHTSGLRDVFDTTWMFGGTGKSISSAQLLDLYRGIDDANTAPDATWSYNNGGYLMLTTAIERIAGRPLEDVLRERILSPVGMHDTLLRRLDTDFVSNSATLHMARLGGGFHKAHMGTYLCGAGGMVSTVDDMLRWLAHMDRPVVGTAETWALMRAPQRLANGVSTGYGLGLMTGPYRGVETVHHAGGVMGGNSHMLKVPSEALDIAIMVNRSDVSAVALCHQILDVCLTGLAPITSAPPSVFATGVYGSATTGRVIELFEKDGQQIVSINGTEAPMLRATDGSFTHAPARDYVQQVVTLKGDPARPSALQFSEFGEPDELTPLPPPTSTDTRAFAGVYANTAHGLTLTIAPDAPRAVAAGPFGHETYELRCLADGVWLSKMPGPRPLGHILRIDARGLRLTTGRTRALPFVRRT